MWAQRYLITNNVNSVWTTNIRQQVLSTVNPFKTYVFAVLRRCTNILNPLVC